MRLAVHNVVHLTDDEVRDRFVVRGAELDELLVHLREEGPPRHVLVIGPRGMGKSLLLRRVAVMVSDEPDLAARWLPVLMPEELYEVTSIADLWMAALDRLATDTGDASLRDQHDALIEEPDVNRVAFLALQRLLDGARRRGCKLLLLAENVQMLFEEQVSGEDGWALRQVLQNEPDLLFMATAVTTFKQVEDSNEAFFGFFRRVQLESLADAEVATLWREITGVELSAGRTTALRVLTGGNPRLVTILGQFARDPELRYLRAEIEALVDEYTPYFKANIEALPAVERKVFVTLADIWAPATAADVARRARMSSSQVSALLGRLVQRGAVETVSHGRGRHYELAERLYNLFHLLRRPDGEGRVQALLDILTHLYDPVDLECEVFPQLIEQLNAMSDGLELDVKLASSIERYLDDRDIWSDLTARESEEILERMATLLEAQRAKFGESDARTLLTRQLIAGCHGEMGDLKRAIDEYESIIAETVRLLGSDHPDTLMARHQRAFYIGRAGQGDVALQLYLDLIVDETRVLGPSHRGTLATRGGVAYWTAEFGDPVKALDLYQGILADYERALGSRDLSTLRVRHQIAWCLKMVGDFDAAAKAAAEVCESLDRVEDAASRVERLRTAARLLCIEADIEGRRARGEALPRELRALLPRLRQLREKQKQVPPSVDTN